MVSKKTEEKIAQLQLIEENLRHVSLKKQLIQNEEIEQKNALEELEKAKDSVYRIVGQIMIKSNKEELKKELLSNQELTSMKMNSLEKQETSINEKAKKLREEVMTEMSNQEKNGSKHCSADH